MLGQSLIKHVISQKAHAFSRRVPAVYWGLEIARSDYLETPHFFSLVVFFDMAKYRMCDWLRGITLAIIRPHALVAQQDRAIAS